MLGNTLPLNKYIISHIKRFCNKNFTQSDSSNRSLCIMSKRKEAKCNCPQPVILKIGNYPSVKNYSNAMKYLQKNNERLNFHQNNYNLPLFLSTRSKKPNLRDIAFLLNNNQRV